MNKTRVFRFLPVLLVAALCVAPCTASAADMIDPATYICAELSTQSTVSNDPPVFESLQIDGYASAKEGKDVAEPTVLAGLLIEVGGQCATRPASTVLSLWEKARKDKPIAQDGPWTALKATCQQLNENHDDGDSFVVWLDAYNRQKTGKPDSILGTQETFDAYFAACKANPDKLMLDVVRELAK